MAVVCLAVWGLGFRVQGAGLRVYDAASPVLLHVASRHHRGRKRQASMRLTSVSMFIGSGRDEGQCY